MHAEALHLRAHQIAQLLGQFLVPALGDGGTDGDGRGVLLKHLARRRRFFPCQPQEEPRGLRQPLRHALGQAVLQSVRAVFIHHISAAQAQPRGAVGHHQAGDAPVQQRAGRLARGARHSARRAADHAEDPALRIKTADVHERGLLVGERRDHGVGLRPAAVVVFDGLDIRRLHSQHLHKTRRLFRLPLGRPVRKVRRGDGGAHPLGEHRLVEAQHGGRSGIGGGIAEAQEIVPLLQHPALLRRVKARKLPHRKAQRHFPALAGLQLLRFGKGREALVRLVHPRRRRGGVELHGLSAGARADVGDGGGHRDLFALNARLARFNRKVRIPEAEAEGKKGLDVRRIEVAVADVDALAVIRIVPVAEAADALVVAPGCPSRGQLSGGTGPAEQKIGQYVPRLRAELAQVQDVLNCHHGAEVDHAAHVQHQQEMLVALPKRQNIPHLGLAEQDVAGDGSAVGALAGYAAEYVDRRIARAAERDIVLGLRHHGAHVRHGGQHAARPGLLFAGAYESLVRVPADVVIAVQPELAADGEARGFQSLLHAHRTAGVDLPGARAALDGAAGAAAEEGDRAGRGQREIPPALEQDRALRTGTPDDGAVLSLVIVHAEPPNHLC